MATNRQATTIDQSQKLSLREKICYFICSLGSWPLSSLLGSYFLIFYTDVVGLDVGALATLLLISKVVDAISDPVTGYLCDRLPVTKYGKFRPMLIVGTIICSINFVLVWFGAVWSPVYKYVIVYATYLLLGFTFDLMSIPLESLLPLLTTDEKDRSTLGSLKGVGCNLGGLIFSTIAPYIVAEETLQNYYILVFGTVVIVAVVVIGGTLGVKEHATLANAEAVNNGTKGEEEHYSIKDMFSFIVMRPVLTVFLANLLGTIASQANSGAGTYFFTYVMGDLTIYSTVNIIFMAAMLPAFYLAVPLARRIGKKQVMTIGFILQGLAMVVRFFVPTNLAMLYVCYVVHGVGSAFVMSLAYTIAADNTTYVLYKSGKHGEAAVASLTSFTSKCAQGVGGSLPGYILDWTGYVANAEVQSTTTLNGIIACQTIIPGIMNLVAAVVMYCGYNLSNKDVQEMTAAVAEREEE